MLARWNDALDAIEQTLTDDVDVVAGDTVVDVAVRYGYGSAESFRRAFVAVRRRRRARSRRADH